MNYSAIKYFDIANGEGVRTSLFVSGCRRHCPYCFNGEAWRFDAGEPFDEAVQAKVIESLGAAFCDGLTILGGEPMEPENQEGLVEFVERVKREVPNKAIWCFTGDTLDELEPGGPHFTAFTDRLLDCIDVLVDGPFENDLHDITLRFRGSSNQRVIDMNATREAAHAAGVKPSQVVALWQDEEVYATHSMKRDGVPEYFQHG